MIGWDGVWMGVKCLMFARIIRPFLVQQLIYSLGKVSCLLSPQGGLLCVDSSYRGKIFNNDNLLKRGSL